MSTHAKRKADQQAKPSTAKVARMEPIAKKDDVGMADGGSGEGVGEQESEIRSSTTEGSTILDGTVMHSEVATKKDAIGGSGNGLREDDVIVEKQKEIVRAPSPEWVTSASGATYSDKMLHRLQDLFRFEDPDTDRFYVGLGPHELSWGRGEMDSHLCRAGTNSSVLWWWVVELSKDFFLCAPGGNPATSISMNVFPVRESDEASVWQLLGNNQTYNGPAPGNDLSTIRLSRRTYTESRSKKRVPYVFKDVYDGRVAVGPKSTMKEYAIDEVGRGDLLLVEFYLTRYRCDEQGKVVYNGGWSRYRSALEFRYITVLREGEEIVTHEPVIDDSKMKRM